MSNPHAAVWPFKDPMERFPVAFSFALELGANEVIEDATVTAVAVSGVDDESVELIVEQPSVSGAQVVVTIAGGVAGVTYSLTCIASTSEGNTFARAAILPVEVASRWNEYRRVINPTTT